MFRNISRDDGLRSEAATGKKSIPNACMQATSLHQPEHTLSKRNGLTFRTCSCMCKTALRNGSTHQLMDGYGFGAKGTPKAAVGSEMRRTRYAARLFLRGELATSSPLSTRGAVSLMGGASLDDCWRALLTAARRDMVPTASSIKSWTTSARLE